MQQNEDAHMRHDFFQQKAGAYDNDVKRVSNVTNIANAILKNICIEKHMHLMDFGAGTGLLLERIAPHVKKITAIDISKSMTEQLMQKRASLACESEILNIDLLTTEVSNTFDGVISSMTMHHIEDIRRMFKRFHSLLHEGGFLAIADLDKEDGSFHTDNSGACHHGFERKTMMAAAQQAGFSEIKTVDASVVEKPQGFYPVFLLTAKK
jgi:cyclopropane fatty-acyl-phospholipid synthase-like methyltransferase